MGFCGFSRRQGQASKGQGSAAFGGRSDQRRRSRAASRAVWGWGIDTPAWQIAEKSEAVNPIYIYYIYNI